MPFVPVEEDRRKTPTFVQAQGVPGGGRAPVGPLNDDPGLGRAVARGVGRGVLSVPGMVGDLDELTRGLTVAGRKAIRGPESAQELQRQYDADPRVAPTTDDLATALTPTLPGLDYTPQGAAERLASTGAEFATGAALTGGRNAARDAVWGAGAGLASEATGIATEGSENEALFRGLASLAGMGAGAFLTGGRQTAEGAVQKALRDVNADDLQEAEQLFREAAEMGIPMTRAQALAQVSGIQGSELQNLQRIVEGRGDLAGHFAPTVDGIRTSGNNMLDRIVPEGRYQGSIGEQVQEAAQGSLDRVSGQINRITAPNYERADGFQIQPEGMERLMSDPLYRQQQAAVRGDPALAGATGNMPSEQGALNDVIQREMGARRDALFDAEGRPLSPIQAQGYGNTRQAVREELNNASGGEWQTVWDEQARLREKYLKPLENGPLGRLAKQPETEGAINVLFPQGPQTFTPEEIGRAVSGLANRNPEAATQLVRAHLKRTFDEATQSLQGGDNQWGGAGWRARIYGNERQAENLRAAIGALPNGRDVLPGFERYMDIMQATGLRQRVGSQTAFNAEQLDALRRGGWGDEALKTLTGNAFSFPARFRDAIEEMRLGANTKKVADLLTNPNAAARFRALANAPSGSETAIRNAIGITGIMVRQTGSNEPSERRAGGFVPVE